MPESDSTPRLLFMCLICSPPPCGLYACAWCRCVRSSLDVSALYSALQVNTSVPQVAVQPPIVINVTTNVTTIPVNPAREEFLTGMVRTYQTLDEDATTSTLLDQFFSYLMDSCIGGAPGPEDLNWTFNGAVSASVELALLSLPPARAARARPAPC